MHVSVVGVVMEGCDVPAIGEFLLAELRHGFTHGLFRRARRHREQHMQVLALVALVWDLRGFHLLAQRSQLVAALDALAGLVG